MTNRHFHVTVSQSNAICDFCGVKLNANDHWTYRTQPDQIGPDVPGLWRPNRTDMPPSEAGGTYDGPGFTHVMDEDGWWAACPECYGFIEADDRVKLIDRSIAIHRQKHGKVIPLNVIRAAITTAHNSFFARRFPTPPLHNFVPAHVPND